MLLRHRLLKIDTPFPRRSADLQLCIHDVEVWFAFPSTVKECPAVDNVGPLVLPCIRHDFSATATPFAHLRLASLVSFFCEDSRAYRGRLSFSCFFFSCLVFLRPGSILVAQSNLFRPHPKSQRMSSRSAMERRVFFGSSLDNFMRGISFPIFIMYSTI